MENKYTNLLTPTTLIPLWAKAVDSADADPILNDTHALQLLRALGYDLGLYDRKKQNPSQVGCCLRAKWMDDEALKFIETHSPCNVIQLGAGIDDRFRRIGMPEGVARWYDLDLPEVAAMRAEVIPSLERNEVLSMDMFDTAWMRRLRDEGLPVLIIVEGVFMYIPREDIGRLFHDIAEYLSGALMLMDSVPPFAVGRARYDDSVRKADSRVEYLFGTTGSAQLAEWFPEVDPLETVYMSDLPEADRFFWLLRFAYRIPLFYNILNQRLLKFRIRKH